MRKQNKIKNQLSSPQIRHVPSGKSDCPRPHLAGFFPGSSRLFLGPPSPPAGSSSRLTDRGRAEGGQRQRLRRSGEGGAKNRRNTSNHDREFPPINVRHQTTEDTCQQTPYRASPGGPGVKNPPSSEGLQVSSPVGELRSHMPQGS